MIKRNHIITGIIGGSAADVSPESPPPRSSIHRLRLLLGDNAGLRLLQLVVFGGFILCGPTQRSLADAVKLGAFWIEGVTVNNVSNGKIYYYNEAGEEFVRGLDELQGLKLDQYPQLSRYEDTVTSGNDQVALMALTEVRNFAREPWLQQWVLYRLTGVYNRLGQPVKAVETFLQLAYSGGEEHYLASVSLDSVVSAQEKVKQELITRLTSAESELRGQPQSSPIDRLLSTLRSNPSGTPAGTGTTSNPPIRSGSDGDPPSSLGGSSSRGNSGGGAGNPSISPITLPRVLDLGDSITKMILSGNYVQAINTADRTMATDSRQTAMRLFQRGVAQMRLAESGEGQDRYKEAGLSFMRVLVYFPQSGYAGPSLVEAGVVHYKLGRVDIARKLFEQATSAIDAEYDSHYAQRLDRLIARLDKDSG